MLKNKSDVSKGNSFSLVGEKERGRMLFSILMCTYNSEATLSFAIDSVRNQSCRDWEMIILDNGSKDGTVKILEKYQKEDKRIHCIFQESNVGWGKGISICLTYAIGQYMIFLAADDLLFHNETLKEVQGEILEYQPDIIWTGHGTAEFDFEKGEYILLTTRIPEFRRYEKEDKLTELVEIMQSVYQGSVMHYVRIAFLKEHNIDFYYPYGGDMQGMTEALCRAKKMTVLNKVEYILTRNTSQTALRTGFYFDFSRQWKSIKNVVPEINQFKQMESLQYIAKYILGAVTCMLENIMLGKLCDNYMNPIDKSFPERFIKAEEWISSNTFGEMMYYAGREVFAEKLINAAGILYYKCKANDKWLMEVKTESKWMADFVEHIFECKNYEGGIKRKKWLSVKEAEKVLEVLQNDANEHRVGAELLLRGDIVFEDAKIKIEIENCLNDYFVFLQNNI